MITRYRSYKSYLLFWRLMQENSKNLIEELTIEEELDEEYRRENHSSKAEKAREKYHAQDRILKGSSLPSRLFFHWISCLLRLGHYCPIDTDDLPKLHDSMHPKIQFENLHNTMANAERSSRKGWTLLKSIAKSYCQSVLALGILSLVITSLTMTAPILTHEIISYVKNPMQQRQAKEGVWLILGIVLITLGKAILQSHLYYRFAIFGFNLSNTLSLLLYEKSLRYPALCEKKYSIPQIINYSQVDAQRMTSMGVQLTSVLYTPLQIIIGIWLMYSYIGVSFAFGMGAMLLMIAATFFMAKMISKVNEETLKRKDQRMKVTEQILDIIRFIKINALEKYFYKKLNDKRNSELQSNRKRGILEVFVVFLYFISCPLIIFLTFLAYVQLGHQIDSTVAFSTIMIFNILQSPLRQFPSALSSLIQMYTSIVRIQQFLLAKEIKHNHILLNTEQQNIAIKMEFGTFRWGTDQSKNNSKLVDKEVIQYRKSRLASDDNLNQTNDIDRSNINRSIDSPDKSNSKESDSQFQGDEVQNISGNANYVTAIKSANITIEKGKFVMVLGDIGSGKSSFLLAILNEMQNSKRATITINGSVAYAAQKPWIMHGTVRDNITFCKAYERKKFDQTLYQASLIQDMKLLVQGEFTEIGEKGSNLSGGQKARISFARATYSERDILLLDDIISAVDVHVAEFLIKETILKYLKGKTIVLATHAANFAEYADEIIILKKGVVVRKGQFKDIHLTQQFRQIYEKQMKKKKTAETEQDKKISNDQKKVKETINLLLQKKKSQQSNASLKGSATTKSFTEKAIEDLIIPQDHKKGSIGLEVVKEYIRLNGGLVFVLVVIGSMAGWLALSIFSNIQMQLWCKDQEHSISHLYVYMILSVTSSLCAFIRAYTLVLSGFKQGEKVHKTIVQSLLYASLNEFYLRVPVGRIMNRLTKDLRQLDETIGYAVGNYLTNLFSLIGTISICIYGSTPFMIIPTVIVIYLCNKLRQYYMKTQREVLRIEAKTNSPIVSGFVSTINGLSTIRAYKVEEEFLDMQIRKIGTNKGARITREALESWFAFRLTLLSFAISIISIVFAMVNTAIDPALVGLLLSYAFNLNDDIISVTFSWANLQTRMISVQRIHNFMQIEPEKAYLNYCRNWDATEEGYNKILQEGLIEYKGVNVRYRDDLPYALKGLSFKIRSGQKVGIVGRTGAGKSTIYASLLRLVDPCGGEILLDGQKSSQYFIKDLRNAITMIDQQPTLIRGSFRQNLDMKGIYTDQQLYKILQECNLYDTVMQRNGLNEIIDNNSLSAGQKQLLCICRAFLKKSKIVIIDEATANIDMKNDELIQKVIKSKFQNSTVLTIAHRLSTLKNSDKIIVMGEGRVLECGSPQQLQAMEGIYAEMISKNLSDYFA